ncbi:acyltransferase family protein [Terriglobus saanensis]|uniref:Acyltransferase 3 n=1 Tax=Terriglobus saanensis (strain ATCC BAA-1853 / DSM 23119 / SP1PR4) TaxID=401053 RepID=E8UZD2_TERSS|nr:acyltransferase [Terriglobus saanensis]ADV83212.1 acyltransferase 3 [Terriglobus saanensis SP1PR4]
MANEEERHLQERTTGRRVFALDALRGLASCVVVAFHARYLAYFYDPHWWQVPFFAGHQAVVLFFVLSGYVLSLSYWRGRSLPYGRYFVRRLFRIWVPFAAALFVALPFAIKLNGSKIPLSRWFYQTWHTPVTGKLVLQGLLMSNRPDINTAFWSLRYEVLMSIVFPPLCWAFLRIGPVASGFFGLALLAAGAVLHSATLTWAACFVLGAALAGGYPSWKSRLTRLPSWAWGSIAVLSLAAYFYGNDIVIAFGACGLLLVAQTESVERLLDWPLPEYLGRISYSLYLVHGTVLFAVVILLYGRMPLNFLLALGVVLSFPVAHLFCVLVEEPSTALGRYLTREKKSVAAIQRESHTESR